MIDQVAVAGCRLGKTRSTFFAATGIDIDPGPVFDPIAVCDIDGVLADFSIAFTQRLRAAGKLEHGIPCSAQKTWHFRDSLPITRKDEDAVWAEIDASRSFWRGLPVIATEGDILALHELVRKVRLVYMTGRIDHGNRTYAQTKNWLIRNRFPVGGLVMQGDKAQGVAMLGGTVVGVLDDKPSALEALSAAGAPVTAMDRPYNSHVDVPRVASVAEWAAQVVGRLG